MTFLYRACASVLTAVRLSYMIHRATFARLSACNGTGGLIAGGHQPLTTTQTPTKEILKAFNRDEYLTLATSTVLNEGVNMPEASVAIYLVGAPLASTCSAWVVRYAHARGSKLLYEAATAGTVEEGISRWRRQHDAYQ